MLEVLSEKLFAFLAPRWRHPMAVLIILALLAAFLLYVFQKTNLAHVSALEWVILSCALFAVVGLWCLFKRVPRAPKGRIGFAVAIVADSAGEQKRIREDFILTLRDLLGRGQLRYPFSLLELPVFYTRKICTEQQPGNYMMRARCKFMIYGRARSRHVQGKDTHVLDLNGIVSHKTLPEQLKKQFSSEFAELFPRRLLLAHENDLFKFEFSSQWIDLVSRYIIGMASLLSGDPDYAESLFKDVEGQLSRIQTNAQPILKIRQRLPSRLAGTYSVQARLAYEHWKRTHEGDVLSSMKTSLDKLQEVGPLDYGLHLLLAIWHFVAERDIRAAKNELRKCKGQADVTWRFSYGFLLAYEGKLSEAQRMYTVAFKGQYGKHVLFDVESFICMVLTEEPSKSQLYYCLGLINFLGKGDHASASRDFETFLERVPPESFKQQQDRARAYLGTIQGKYRSDTMTS